MRFVSVLAGTLGIVALAVAGLTLTSSGASAADTVEVEVDSFYFCDASFQGQVCETDITAGDTIEWSVEGGAHTVTQCADANFSTCPPSGGFDSGTLSAGATYDQAFATAGTYYYRCNFHPTQMMGKIVVSAAETAAPTATASPGASTSSTPTMTAGSVPQTGGPPGDSGSVALWQLVLLALGGALLVSSVATFAVMRSSK